MPATRHLTLETVDFDNPAEADMFIAEVMTFGRQRVHAETVELRAKGLIDAEGKLISRELRPDIGEGSARDFGR